MPLTFAAVIRAPGRAPVSLPSGRVHCLETGCIIPDSETAAHELAYLGRKAAAALTPMPRSLAATLAATAAERAELLTIARAQAEQGDAMRRELGELKAQLAVRTTPVVPVP